MKLKSACTTLLFAGVLAAGLVGCEKEQPRHDTQAPVSPALLVAQVTTMTQDYLSTIPPSAERNGNGKRIIAADLAGALTGFLAGAKIGVVLGLEGALVIGGISGILGGAGASFAAAGINPPSGTTPPSGNPGNLMEHVGVHHYRIIDEMSHRPEAFMNGNGQLDHAAYYTLAFDHLEAAGIANANHRALLPREGFEVIHDNALGHPNVMAFLNNLSDPEFLPTERAILGQYFGALMGANNAASFGAYSIGVENQITNSNAISAQSKALLLMEMSTARHGMAYWE
jgi:uncharacterized membrane protein